MSIAATISIPTERQILPKAVTNRTERRNLARWAKSHAAHTTAFHAVRSPLYVGRMAAYAPVGLGRTILGGLKWASDWDSREMRQAIIKSHDANLAGKFATAEKLHSERVKFRACTLGIGAAAVAGVGMSAAFWGTGVEQLGLAVSAFGGLGYTGRPRNARLVESAHVRPEAQKLTADFVTQALCSIGVAGMRDPEMIPTPLVVRDGRGWRAEIDLPAGITASQVMERRENLAAALSRPLGSVWPTCETSVSPGRLMLWVGDQDLSTMAQGRWPVADASRGDYFKPFAFGENAKGDIIEMCLAETNVLIGAIPGAGKTTALRNILLSSVLDSRTELWLWEFKGTGDFDALAPLASRFGSGPDDGTVADALDGLRSLERECEKRAALVKSLPDDAPEHKVTPELANRRGLHPLVVAMDEVQELFGHSKYGKEAGELAERIIKRGRALGVTLLIATQRPDSKSLPTGISDNVGTRFCLRVMGHIANDMILGTSSHKLGIKATLFTNRDRGMGYLVGQHDDAQIVRVFNASPVDTGVIVQRALALRGDSTLEGQRAAIAEKSAELRALKAGLFDQFDDRDDFEDDGLDLIGSDLLTDVLNVAGDNDIWMSDLCEALNMDAGVLRDRLKEFGVLPQQVFRRVDGKPVNKKGVRLSDVRRALETSK